MCLIQSLGALYKMIADERSWHILMDVVYIYKIGICKSEKSIISPNGGMDYIEVKIKDDLTLDRTSAKYISNGKTKTLTKQGNISSIFTEDYWIPFSMPNNILG